MLDCGLNKLRRDDARPVGWAVSKGRVPYPEAVEAMKERASAIADGEAGELVWLLEHPPLYTAGVSARAPTTQASKPRTKQRTSRPRAFRSSIR